MPTPAAVSGLSLRYPNGKLALADVDLEVQAGELLIVLGGNGCGKTTLLRCITRVLAPDCGRGLAGRHRDLAACPARGCAGRGSIWR